ncbi:SDR family oxidoreductase [Aspergillus affinis]|uniref:SDR family oxidoreductase n=1 Tax=Aspergillus affinis TaxID=1070780 RepID=UPI0022FEEC16|nr:3-oxoacyl-reductase [Aspergillus affinis]KAI9036186.1 3-oxoacyl-reductase [Aspergillus affinis]
MSHEHGRIWLITGSSSGLGLQLALTASSHGDTVIALTRDPNKLASSLANAHPHIIPYQLDPTTASASDLTTLLDTITTTYGPIDILVNNAGYILTSTIEEATDEEITAQFSVNLFSQIRLVRAVTPSMRARRAGTIASLGSIGAWTGYPATGLYCASKAAVAIYTETLKAELKEFGIDVVCIEPGYFRTGFLAEAHSVKAIGREQGEEKGNGEEVVDSAATREMREALRAYSGRQPGDPGKGARVMYEALTKTGRFKELKEKGEALPARLAVGRDAIGFIGESLEREREMLERWGGVIGGTDCDDVN